MEKLKNANVLKRGPYGAVEALKAKDGANYHFKLGDIVRVKMGLFKNQLGEVCGFGGNVSHLKSDRRVRVRLHEQTILFCEEDGIEKVR